MSDLISRQDALDAIDKALSRTFAEPCGEMILKDVPSATRPTGRWTNNMNGTFTCDQCGCKHSRSNFCPNCGARMEDAK